MIKNIVIGALIFGFIGCVVFLDIPMLQNISDIKKTTETQQKLLEEKRDFIQTVKKLAEKYDGNEDIFKKLDSILPDDQDTPNLIVQLEALAGGNGMILNDFLISETEKTEKVPDYKTVSISLKLNGSYEAFKNFLVTVENNMRLIDINSVNFQTQAESENNSSFDFDVILKTYYQTK